MSTLPMQGSFGTRAKQIERQRLAASFLRKQGIEALANQPEGSYTKGGPGNAMFGAIPQIYVPPANEQYTLPWMQQGLAAFQDMQTDKTENADAEAQVADANRVLSSLPKTTGMRSVTKTIPGETTVAPESAAPQMSPNGQVMPKIMLPGAMAKTVTTPDRTETVQEEYKLTEDEYLDAQSKFAAGLDPDNPLLDGIRNKMLLNAIDAPEKMYAREDAQKQRESDLQSKLLETARIDAERRGDKIEAARLLADARSIEYQQDKELEVAQHNDIMALGRYRVDNSRGGAGGGVKTSDMSDKFIKAVGDGRIPMKQLNSRTLPIYQAIIDSNPDADITKLGFDQVLGGNATYQGKAQSLRTLKSTVANVVEAGKKLKFPENAPAAKVDQWVKQFTRDPAYTEYMTQRNDAVMTIAYAMRQAGMSDLATKLEMESFPVNSSPAQFEAWAAGQNKAIEERVKQNEISLHNKSSESPPGKVLTKAVEKANPKAGDLDNYLKSQGF